PLEVQIAAIHDIEGTWFWQEYVEHIDVVQLAIGDVNKRRDSATQIEQCMQFDGGFGLPKMCPRKNREAQIDRRSIERVNRIVEFETKVLVGIESPGNLYQ